MPISPLVKQTVWVSVTAFLLSVGAGIGLQILGQADRRVEAQTPQQTTQTIPITVPASPQLDDRLKASIRLASQSRYVEALKQLNEINPDDPVAAQAQILREVWSLQMLDRALAKYNEADLEGAIAIAVTIPSETEAGRQSQQQLPTWKRQQLIIKDGLALIQSNPQEALARFKVLEDTSFAKSNRYQKWVAQAQSQARWQHQHHAH